MATVSWLSGTDGDWNVGGSWSGGVVPNGTATDVSISVAPAGGSFSYTVGVAVSESFTTGALLLNADGAFLNVAGTLDATGQLVVQAGDLELAGGTVIAAGLTLSADGNVDGNGTIAGAGTLSDAGLINSDTGTLVLAPNVLSVADGGILQASGDVLMLSPAGGLSNFAGGTLTTGVYQAASGGTIDLPSGDAVTVDAASIVLNDGGSIGAPSSNSLIQAVDPLQATLQTIAAIGVLSVEGGYDYVTGNRISVAGTLELAQGIFTSGNLDVMAGGQLIGHGLVSTAAQNDGTIAAIPDPAFFLQPGSADTLLTISGSITGTGSLAIEPSATLALGAATAQDVTFSTSGVTPGRAAMLVLDQPIAYSGTIGGFQASPIVLGTPQPSDAIDLAGIATTGLGKNYVPGGSGGTLVLSEGTTTVELNFSGSYATSEFVLSPDSGSGTLITLACFVAGTRIATPAGEVAVERLAAGDMVQTVTHGAAAVQWIGRRRIDCRRHRDPARVRPVRISAGAFGGGRPWRDLMLSPDHAVFVDDVLIPVRLLMNGTTIRQKACGEVTYLHVELARHAVLLAEGLPAESYLDIGEHANFANGDGPVALHADFASRVWEAKGCAPPVVTGGKLDEVRHRLSVTAGEMLRITAATGRRRAGARSA